MLAANPPPNSFPPNPCGVAIFRLQSATIQSTQLMRNVATRRSTTAVSLSRDFSTILTNLGGGASVSGISAEESDTGGGVGSLGGPASILTGSHSVPQGVPVSASASSLNISGPHLSCVCVCVCACVCV